MKKIGDLRNFVSIQTATETSDSLGGVTQTWKDFCQSWAAIEPLSVRELLNFRAINTEVTHKIIIRYIPDVTHKMRIKFGSRIFNIKGIINKEESNRFLEITCLEEFVT